ncbi:hypothetical protein I305_02102 [Cryptococcus gattii E566]|uniref:Uncharacterized protein n=2 Tax=Cryptococcus gattii TaxID=37769 RepID=E6RD87_CRYGW|nr:Hypothetical Protein CGB_K0730W [Cryptococcus gattii WM276]ADV24761.1 Hypothetical Protein CGB_K0730W [Cryptococcus gattii WM276]KIR79263.1 hypothetical protein I306_03682 [Cryptococcus gattii EJB2]KIY35196.1 hypothetical protein I305_02102 [Cryptococcus gattii E566]KJE05660.1 hypothetical protein I311_00385 [Cryptococcus gattii NT-10]
MAHRTTTLCTVAQQRVPQRAARQRCSVICCQWAIGEIGFCGLCARSDRKHVLFSWSFFGLAWSVAFLSPRLELSPQATKVQHAQYKTAGR